MKFFRSHSPKKILRRLKLKFPEIKEALIASNEGLPLESTFSNEIEHVIVAGVSLAILSAAKRIISDTDNGAFKQICIKSTGGYLLGYWLGRNKVLLVSSTKFVNLESVI